MLEYLNDIDTDALLAVNGLHDMFQDAFWWMVSAKWSSALLLLALVWILLHQNRRHALLMLVMLAFTVLVADQVSSGLIKHLVERLRPTHDPSLDNMVHVINGYRGGMYGFVSSHAANFFAVATLLSFVMRHRLVTCALFTWALLQCYSRVYLGVHYPGDIMGGIVVGVLAGWLLWCLMRWIQHRWRLPQGHYTRPDATIAATASMDRPFALILGGSEKNADFTELSNILVKERPNLRRIALIGATAERMLESLSQAGLDTAGENGSSIQAAIFPTLEEAFQDSLSIGKGGIVIMSPACASFGLFKNYKERGKAFDRLVENYG